MGLRILHTNDFHGTLDAAKVAFLQSLRTPETLYCDSGDCIRAGNLAIPIRPELAWTFLAQAGCDASVLGNRETHVLESAFAKKIEGATHPILVANLVNRSGTSVFSASTVIERAGLKIGLIGAMVPMVTERMATAPLSAFLWSPPMPAVKREAARLRPEVDVLIALTHIGHRQDCELAGQCPELDVILGGHSHTVLPEPVRLGSTWICQGGSHGKFVGVYEWDAGGLSGGLRPLGTE